MSKTDGHRPVPAVAVRARVPAEYLRILHDWAVAIAEYQASINNHAIADHALWMRAVLNPEWEAGRCDGLSPAHEGMWATCGSSDPHDAHEQLGVTTRPERSAISAFWPEPEGFRGEPDGATVELAGVVAYWQRNISRQGNTYATGVLRAGDGDGEVPFLVPPVPYTAGGQHLVEGEACTLTGRVDRRGPLHLLDVRELRGPDVHLIVGPREYIGLRSRGWVACDRAGRRPIPMTQRTRDVAKATCRACIATVSEAARCDD